MTTRRFARPGEKGVPTGAAVAWRRWCYVAAVALVLMPLLGSCSDTDSEGRRAQGDAGSSAQARLTSSRP